MSEIDWDEAEKACRQLMRAPGTAEQRALVWEAYQSDPERYSKIVELCKRDRDEEAEDADIMRGVW